MQTKSRIVDLGLHFLLPRMLFKIIVILDYFRNRNKFQGGHTETAVNWFNIAGIVIGFLIANLLHRGIAALNAMAVAAVCYFLGELAHKKND